MRVKIAVRAANAERNARYLDKERGTTIYAHIADIWMPFRPRIISTNDREALYVIDALLDHETDFAIQEHATDTHGSSTHVFALCALLGFRFAPRLASVLDQRLFTVNRPGDYGPLNALVQGRASAATITANWDAVLRAAASIRHGTVSASLLMRRLAAYPRQHRLAQALNEMGKLERTLFILDYVRDQALQRRVLTSLNKGEATHSLGRALAIGRQGELRDRAVEDQLHRASCLHLLIGAIAAWNVVYLTRAIAAVRAQGEDVPEALLTHISPVGWEHINFLGRYHFDLRQPWTLEHLRPLRTEAEIAAVGETGDEEDLGPW
jgi:TnpA family transposase